jgi:hypothetical protein
MGFSDCYEIALSLSEVLNGAETFVDMKTARGIPQMFSELACSAVRYVIAGAL